MSLELIVSIFLTLDICLIMFAIAMAYRHLLRQRSSLIPGLRSFDDTPSPRRRQENRIISEIISMIFIAFGGIIATAYFNILLIVLGGLGILFCGLFLQIYLRVRTRN